VRGGAVEEDSGEGSGGGSVPWGEQEGKTAGEKGLDPVF
jgi:hypothetical protein